MHHPTQRHLLPSTRTFLLAIFALISYADGTILSLAPSIAMAASSSSPSPSPSPSSSPDPSSLAVATRLHLGYAANPPPISRLRETISSFSCLAREVGANMAIIAVDGTSRFEGYDLVGIVEDICHSLSSSRVVIADGREGGGSEGGGAVPTMIVLPVTPWGRFVPALNAIVSHCADAGVRRLLVASAEVRLSRDGMDALVAKFDDNIDGCDTLVVGAVLRGHDYRGGCRGEGAEGDDDRAIVQLTGRTVPWNTCALWDVPKLALTGFLLISEGLHPPGGDAGVEEVATIAVIQRILSRDRARAKLVMLSGDMVSWEEDFDDDPGRREWHERKMESKVTRARRQLELLGLNDGVVMHC